MNNNNHHHNNNSYHQMAYMHKPESIQENETHKILKDFEIPTDPLIQVGRTDLVLINNKQKKVCRLVDFVVPTDHRKGKRQVNTWTLIENKKRRGTWVW